MARYELSDTEWQRIEPMLPPETGRKARPSKDNRRMVNGMVWILGSGAPWRDLPERYGPWQSVYTRFRRWTQMGVWQRILEQLIQDEPVQSIVLLDSTIVRAHQHAAGAKGGKSSRL